MKETLRSKCLSVVEPYLNADGVVERGTSRTVISSIHTDIVQSTIDSLEPNRVLNAKPPPIDPQETFLPRQTRTTLSQLRSGHCARLQSYQYKIGSSASNVCPDCQAQPHTTSHLFECTAHPTDQY